MSPPGLPGGRAGKERIPLAGFPMPVAEGYICRLLEQGYKVVVCEQQTQGPAPAWVLTPSVAAALVAVGAHQ